MQVIQSYQTRDIATVFLGRTDLGNEVEFVESIQPPLSRSDKEVVIVSTLVGCPVGCMFCDAGGFYRKKLVVEEILEQIDWVVESRYQSRQIPAKKFKIQFARMGEPSLNDAVLDVLEQLPSRYDAPGLLPSLSSVAPKGRDMFFGRLQHIKEKLYPDNFQLQFSIHSTDQRQKRLWIPIETWSFERIAAYGFDFVKKGSKKISLNFALSKETIVDPGVIAMYFDPNIFLIKITPVNPTYRAAESNICSGVEADSLPYHPSLIKELKQL
ncbi:MAG: radical SAM protein, partial [Deltaproteobacteria bacterium]|nr:radical SAM protein [Deltaproteobacteria bacterium]